MRYEKPELSVEKFTFEPVTAAEFTSTNPDPLGPVIEESDPWYENTKSAFGEVFDFSK